VPLVFPAEIAFVAMVAAFGAFLLLRTETMWLRPLVQALQHPHGSWWKRVVLKPLAVVAEATLYVEKHVRLALSHFASGSLHMLTRWFHGLAASVHHLVKEIGDFADDLARAISVLIHHKIPAIVHRITAPIDARARAALRVAHRSISLIRELDHRVARWLHGIDRLLRDTVIPRIRHAERAIARVITRDLPALRRRERALEREVIGLRSRIGRIEKALGLGIFAALVYKVLARVAPWLFCRNWKVLGRAVCGMRPDSLANLLALLLGAWALSDLRRTARIAEDALEFVTGVVWDAAAIGDRPRGRFTID